MSSLSGLLTVDRSLFLYEENIVVAERRHGELFKIVGYPVNIA